jgi:hypothetical protein
VFIEQTANAVYEHFLDVNAAVYTVKNVALRASHLADDIVEMAYLAEPVPMILVRRRDGTMAGMIYRRVYLSAAREPELNAWFQYSLPEGASIASLASGEIAVDQPAIAMIVADSSAHYSLEYAAPKNSIYSGWLLDRASAPIASAVLSDGVRLYGFPHLEGEMVTVLAGSLDCGEHLVQNGYVDVPFGNGVTGGTGEGQFTATYWATAPAALVGVNYISRGQRLRPMAAIDTGVKGSATAFAKTKKVSEAALMIARSRGIYIGTSFDHLHPLRLENAKGARVSPFALFSGVYRQTVDDVHGYDGMVAWEIRRPVPALVTAVGTFQKTQE